MEALTDLYEGAGQQAYDRVEGDAASLRRSLMLLNSQFVRSTTLYIHGLAAVASLDALPPARRMARVVRAGVLAMRLGREGMGWTDTLCSILSAAVANARGERTSAIARLREAIERAERVDMSLYAAAARHQLGLALGGEAGDRLVEQSVGVMRAQDVRRPERFAAMLVPGRW